MFHAGKCAMTHLQTARSSYQGICPVAEAVERLAGFGGVEERGAIYTRREVVEFVLDLVGYTVDRPLAECRLLEPSFGAGDFILPAAERLLTAAGRVPSGLRFKNLAPAIRGVELHRETFRRGRQAMREMLIGRGVSARDAESLLETWLAQDDFLLRDLDQDFTHAVGNPPYVRQEAVPDALMGEYRLRYGTIHDRADLYVPFIERSLSLLGAEGKLGFICSDRWMKNRYGRKLREFVGGAYHLATYVDMVGTDAFRSRASAYPAITVIERSGADRIGRATRVFARPKIDGESLGLLAREMSAPRLETASAVREIEGVAADGEPWILEDFEALALVRRLEKEFPTLEEAGCKVGIGVATGADKAFIGNFGELDVEPCRKLPLAMTRDISGRRLKWRGKGVINPFGDDGSLVDLDEYPRLRRYLEEHRGLIASRHVAVKSPRNWYRTIDRIQPGLARREKLLIPDIKGDATILHENGELYPHHNLYYVVSDVWGVRALQAIMRSGMARLFVSLYSTRMRGGYLRFQAQNLRRIRLPRWESVSASTRKRLARFTEAENCRELDEIVANLYGLSSGEMKLIEDRYRQ